MKEHIAVEHDEAIPEQVAGEPHRVQTVRGRVASVAHHFDVRSADLEHVVRSVAHDDDNRVGAARAQRADLPLDQRTISDPREALGAIAEDRTETAATAGGENDGSHAPSGTGSRAARRRIMADACERYSCRSLALMPNSKKTSA